MGAVKTRKLSDLYRRGAEISVDDGSGEDPVTVWLQKLNPVENETAIRLANAARARFLLKRKDEESPEFLAILNDVIDYTREDLVSFIATQDVAARAEALEAEFAEEKKWNEDDYLQGLNDAWNEGLEERYLSPEEDEEADQCFAELTRFQTEFAVRIAGETEAKVADYEAKSEDDLRDIVIDKLFRLQADMAWLIEFRKCELWLGTHASQSVKEKYFSTRAEVDELEVEIISRLIEEFSNLTVPVTEGKDSEATEASSKPSDLPETLEVEDSSGQVVARV